MTDDTTFDDPLIGTEAEMLLFALERARAQFAWKYGASAVGPMRGYAAP